MGFLFVTQTRKNQNAIAELLGSLQQIAGSKRPLPIRTRSESENRPE
jgi:hypothetical protein